MPPVVAGALIAGGTIYAANKASSASNKAADAAKAAAERPFYTNYGSSNVPKTGQVSIDPSIRTLREQVLGRLPQYREDINNSGNTYLNSIDQSKAELQSNQNPFIQARVNPLLASAAAGRGALSRGLTSRGLGGSSLYSSSLGNYDAQVGRAAGDQRALATNESLAAVHGLDTDRYNAALSHLQAVQGMDQQEQSVAAQNLAQELSALGLSQADTAGILQAAGLSMQAGQIQSNAYGRAFDTVGRTLGGMSFPSSSSAQPYSSSNPGAII